jgi:hypothetical protein
VHVRASTRACVSCVLSTIPNETKSQLEVTIDNVLSTNRGQLDIVILNVLESLAHVLNLLNTHLGVDNELGNLAIADNLIVRVARTPFRVGSKHKQTQTVSAHQGKPTRKRLSLSM